MKKTLKLTILAVVLAIIPPVSLSALVSSEKASKERYGTEGMPKKQYKKNYKKMPETIGFTDEEKKALTEIQAAIKELEVVNIFCTSGTRLPKGAKELGKFNNPDFNGMPGSGKFCKIYIKSTIKPAELIKAPAQEETVSAEF